jgi:CBS domain containing-hemolysin-like protein
MGDMLTWILLGICIVLSFVLSGMESGVMALHRLRVRQAARAGSRNAIALQRHLDHTEDFLWTILVGNTIANFLIFSLGTLQLGGFLRNQPAVGVPVFIAAVFVFYILCELLPKTLFRRFPDRLTLLLARPFHFIHLGLSPIIKVVDWFSHGLLRWTGGKIFTGQLFGDREDLRALMQDETTTLTSEEKTMINRVFDLQNLRVRHIAIPLNKVATVRADSPMSQALTICRESNFNRLPVVNPATGRIMGVLNMAELIFLRDLDPAKKAGDYLQPAIFLNGGLSLEDALHRLQRGGGRMGVVLGPDHRELGIISLQDILKTIFGEVTL